MPKEKEARSKEPPAPTGPELVYETVFTRDEVYRLVASAAHSAQVLLSNPTFAIRNRGNQYSSIAMKLDRVYQELIEKGLDAKFTVKFFAIEKEEKAHGKTAGNDV